MDKGYLAMNLQAEIDKLLDDVYALGVNDERLNVEDHKVLMPKMQAKALQLFDKSVERVIESGKLTGDPRGSDGLELGISLATISVMTRKQKQTWNKIKNGGLE